MEFRFNLNDYLKDPICEINNNLIPPDFTGDRRTLWDTVNRIAEVVDEIGQASAGAQGLSKPITSAERLRHSEHSIYLLKEPDANSGKGAITGMLKIGKKGLYVFDQSGQHYQVTTPCVLDFYVHEKHQRQGLGKKLFEHMLQRENIHPHNLAIDRPSEKFLNFLNKHYNLNNPVKQMNNFVVFDKFFPESKGESSGLTATNTNTQDITPSPPQYGRYGAPRPQCSMGQIIHNQSSLQNSPGLQGSFQT